MSDYIRKSALIELLYKTFEEYSMATDKQDKLGGFGVEVFKRVKEQPTVDEKEIIRKYGKQIIEKMKESGFLTYNARTDDYNEEAELYLAEAIDIVKGVCGINE